MELTVRAEAGPEAQNALLRGDLREAVDDTGVRHETGLRARLHVLQASLDHVRREGEERADEASAGGGGQVQLHASEALRKDVSKREQNRAGN